MKVFIVEDAGSEEILGVFDSDEKACKFIDDLNMPEKDKNFWVEYDEYEVQ